MAIECLVFFYLIIAWIVVILLAILFILDYSLMLLPLDFESLWGGIAHGWLWQFGTFVEILEDLFNIMVLILISAQMSAFA